MMREELFIRFLKDETAAVEWLVRKGPEIANSGLLDSSARLDELVETAKGKSIKIIIPGSDCMTQWLTIPKRQARQLIKAIPFMMEDKLAVDIDGLHFATGRRQGDLLEVIAIAHTQLQKYLKVAAKYDFKVEQVYTDTQALEAEKSSIYVDAQSFLAKLNNQTYRFEYNEWQELLPALTDQVAEDESIRVVLAEADFESYFTESTDENIDSELDAALDLDSQKDADSDDEANNEPEIESSNHKYQVEIIRQGLAFLVEQLPMQNLLQGQYDNKESVFDKLGFWKLPLGLAASWVLISLLGKGVIIWELNQQIEVVEQQIAETYKQAFPNERISKDKNLTVTMRQKLRGLSNVSGSDTGYLELLEQLSKGFASPLDVKPTYMTFNKRTNELRIDLDGKDVESLTKFESIVKSAEISATLSSMNSNDNRFSARLVLRASS